MSDTLLKALLFQKLENLEGDNKLCKSYDASSVAGFLHVLLFGGSDDHHIADIHNCKLNRQIRFARMMSLNKFWIGRRRHLAEILFANYV
jgi:hypothetical protein